MNNLSSLLNNSFIKFGTDVMRFLSIDAVPNDWAFWIKLLLVIIIINNIWDLCRELINIISNLGNGSKIDLGSIFNDVVWIYIALVCLKYWFL
jgi:hypothetical protein